MDCVLVTESRRLSTKAYLLTYSQTALSKVTLYAFLTSGPAVERLIVAEEKHQDGNPHLHAYIVYAKQRDVTFHSFDIGGEHPNISTHKVGSNPVKSHWNCWQYCQKEDDSPMILGSPPPMPTVPPPKRQLEEGEERPAKRSRKNRLMDHCVALVKRPEGNVKQAFDYLLAQDPAYAIEQATKLRAELQRIRTDTLCPDMPPRPLSDFKYAPKLPFDWHVLFLSGPTRMGKTSYARALLPEAPVISHKDQLKDADMTKGLIFDDHGTSHLAITFVIHLLDWNDKRGIDVKHSHVDIPCHTRKIFTSNLSWERWISAIDDQKTPRTQSEINAARRRVHVVNIHSPLFARSASETPGQVNGSPERVEPDEVEEYPVQSGRAVDDYFMSDDYNQPE